MCKGDGAEKVRVCEGDGAEKVRVCEGDGTERGGCVRETVLRGEVV